VFPGGFGIVLICYKSFPTSLGSANERFPATHRVPQPGRWVSPASHCAALLSYPKAPHGRYNSKGVDLIFLLQKTTNLLLPASPVPGNMIDTVKRSIRQNEERVWFSTTCN